MPNRAYTRLWRAIAVGILLTGLLLAFHPLWILFSEFHARSAWPRAQAQIASGQVRSAPENHAPGGNPSIRSPRRVYWAEFHIDFQPSNGCRTDISAAPGVATSFPCSAFIQTIPSESQSSAYEWLRRYPSGSLLQVLYDPNGPGVRLDGASLVDLLPWNNIGMALLFLTIGLFLLAATRRRLAALSYLPNDQDLPPQPAARPLRTKSSI